MLEKIQSYGMVFVWFKSDDFGSKYCEKENLPFLLIFNA